MDKKDCYIYSDFDMNKINESFTKLARWPCTSIYQHVEHADAEEIVKNKIKVCQFNATLQALLQRPNSSPPTNNSPQKLTRKLYPQTKTKQARSENHGRDSSLPFINFSPIPNACFQVVNVSGKKAPQKATPKPTCNANYRPSSSHKTPSAPLFLQLVQKIRPYLFPQTRFPPHDSRIIS